MLVAVLAVVAESVKATPLSGSGTETDPYIIATTADWTEFCDNHATYKNSYIKMANFVTAATNKYFNDTFSGTFDGDGYTLTVNISGEQVAPFMEVSNGTIKNLRVAGSITGSGNHTSGLVSKCTNGTTCTIQNCIVSATITNTANLGGFIGHGTAATTINMTDCVFNGTLNYSGASNGTDKNNNTFSKKVGGFVSWEGNGTTIFNLSRCLFDGTINCTAGFTPFIVKYSGCNVTGCDAASCLYTVAQSSGFPATYTTFDGTSAIGQTANQIVTTMNNAGGSGWRVFNGKAEPTMRPLRTLDNIPDGWTVTASGDPVTVTDGTATISVGATVVLTPTNPSKVRNVTLVDPAPAQTYVEHCSPDTTKWCFEMPNANQLLQVDYYHTLTLSHNAGHGTVEILRPGSSSTISIAENVFQYCYDCQRQPDYPTVANNGYNNLYGFSDPYVGLAGIGYGFTNSSTGPWKLEYVGQYSHSEYSFGVSYVRDTYGLNSDEDVPIFLLYQWSSTTNQYEPVVYGVACAYSQYVANEKDHTLLFVAEGHWGCFLSNDSHVGQNLNISFDEDLSMGMHDFAVAATHALPDGVVDNHDGTYSVIPGTQVTIGAIANTAEYYYFDNWTNEHGNVYTDGVTTSSDAHTSLLTFTVTGDTTVRGNFKIDTYTLSVKINNTSMGHVSIGETECTSDKDTVMTNHQHIDVTAIPEPGHYFVNWTNLQGDTVSTSITLNWMATTNATFTANFAAYATLQVASNNPAWGTVEEPQVVAGNTNHKMTIYDESENTTNNSIPAYTCWFDALTKSQHIIPASKMADAKGGTISSIKYYMEEPVTWTSTVEVDVYLKEVGYSTLNDMVDKGSCTVVYTGLLHFVDDSLTITFNSPYTYNGGNLLVGFENLTADAYYCGIHFMGEEVPGASMSSIGSNNLYQQNFLPQCTFTYQPAGAKKKSDDSYYIIPGSEVTVTATPAAGHQFVKWTDENSNVMGTDAQLTFTITGDTTTTANFKSSTTYTLELTSNDESKGTVAIQTVEGSKNIISYSTILVDSCCESMTNEGCDSLFDGIASGENKWCTNATQKVVVFHTANPVLVNGYTLFTGNDNKSNKGRNPKNWELKAKLASNDSWITIATVNNDNTMKDTNYIPYDFNIDVPDTYQYFRFEVSEVHDGNVMQLGEMQLFYQEHLLPDGVTPGTTPNTYIVEEGTEVTVIATPKTGNHFVNWEDNSTNATRTVTITGNTTITANFQPIITYPLTLASNDETMGTVAIQTTDGNKNIIPYGSYGVDDCCASGEYQDCGRLFNNSTSSGYDKWCTKAAQKFVEFHTLSPQWVNGYTLYTGNDNTTWGKGRNPKSWVLKAKLESNDSWTTIATVNDDKTMKDIDETPYDFSIDVPGIYKYFRFEVSEVKHPTDSVLQLGEMQLFYQEHLLPEGVTPGTTSNTYIVEEGTEVTVIATPKTGHHFVNWTDEEDHVMGTDTHLMLTITGDTTATAKFQTTITYPLTLSSNDETMGKVAIQTVDGSKEIIPYTSYEVDACCVSMSDEDCEKLFDDNTSSGKNKWCTNAAQKFVEFHTANLELVNGYTLFTGNDNASTWGKGRNPKSWVLKAKSGNEWITIATVNNDYTMKDTNSTPYDFSIDVPGIYQYFRFEVNEVQSGSVLQLGEMQLFYQEHYLPDGVTPGTASNSYFVDEGTEVTVIAKPKSGYDFLNWEDNSTNATRTVTVTRDTTLTATFDMIPAIPGLTPEGEETIQGTRFVDEYGNVVGSPRINKYGDIIVGGSTPVVLSSIIVSKGSTGLSSDKVFYYAPGDTYIEAVNRPENKLAGGYGWNFWIGPNDATIFYKEESSGLQKDMAIDGNQHLGQLLLNSEVNPAGHTYTFIDQY
jgi:uncharacterized repeat protein (TIGR02543 family)